MIKVGCKWILCGEHTVTRYGKALAFPSSEYSASLDYAKNSDFVVSSNSPTFAKIFEKAIFTAAEFIGYKDIIEYECNLDINIPLMSGLGGSAAVSVLVARFFQETGVYSDPLRLALYLDNEVFHKSGSGIDVNTIYYDQASIFSRFTGVNGLNISWLPNFKIFHSGIGVSTIECIRKVEDAMYRDPIRGTKLDLQMMESTEDCLQGLLKKDIHLLTSGMNRACECFYHWGLCPPHVQELLQTVRSQGAIAVKPTGSGGGGCVIALFED